MLAYLHLNLTDFKFLASTSSKISKYSCSVTSSFIYAIKVEVVKNETTHVSKFLPKNLHK